MRRALLGAALLVSGAFFGPARGAEAPDVPWTEFRGPTGQGTSASTHLPVSWSENQNIAWKSDLPGLGWSSPVIQGKQIWLTAGDAEKKQLWALCLDRDTGSIVHQVEIAAPQELGTLHGKNSLASPTPVLEGDRVYVHFGPHGTACLTRDGEIVWKISLPHQQAYGSSSSPVLHGDLLIVSCFGSDVQYLVALDKRDGHEVWRQPFKARNAESTPLIIQTDAGSQLISNQADQIVACDPANGRELWRVTQELFAQVPRPVHGHGLVFVCGGYYKPEIWAIRPNGAGDVTGSHVAWKSNEDAPLNPSPVLAGDELYLVSDKGIASCLDARTGKRHWRERLDGEFSASPLFADGRIYFTNETGETTVIAAEKTFERLATNALPGRTLASLAVAGEAIYFRTDSSLYRIELP